MSQKTRHKAVISGVGPDHPGIVAAIGKVLLKHQANIEDSSMTRMAKEFAVILIISMPKDVTTEQLEKDLYPLEENLGMALGVKSLDEHDELVPEEDNTPYLVIVSGSDQAGITYYVSQTLADHQINITDLNAQVIEGEDGPAYIMMLEVMTKSTMKETDLLALLKPVQDKLKLEINVKPLDSVAL